jgi:anti-sigma factor RsiW
MTDHRLNCARFEDQLSSWLDGEMDALSAAAMERHATECPSCASLATGLRSIRAGAASLQPLSPSRDLWSGIDARIAAPVIPIGIAGASHGRTDIANARRAWLRPAAAAAALVLMTAGITHVVETRAGARAPGAATVASVAPNASRFAPHDTAADAPAPRAPIATEPAVVAPPAAVLASTGASTAVPEVYRVTGDLASHNVEASYDGEITRLRAIVNQNRVHLDSATVAVLTHNLQVIDSAIVQCRAALKHDPGSRFLIESLDNALRSKVELLRTTATMSS